VPSSDLTSQVSCLATPCSLNAALLLITPSGRQQAAASKPRRACRWVIQDALKVAAHALLLAFNVFGVRTWDAGKAGIDGRLLGIRVSGLACKLGVLRLWPAWCK